MAMIYRRQDGELTATAGRTQRGTARTDPAARSPDRSQTDSRFVVTICRQ